MPDAGTGCNKRTKARPGAHELRRKLLLPPVRTWGEGRSRRWLRVRLRTPVAAPISRHAGLQPRWAPTGGVPSNRRSRSYSSPWGRRGLRWGPGGRAGPGASPGGVTSKSAVRGRPGACAASPRILPLDRAPACSTRRAGPARRCAPRSVARAHSNWRTRAPPGPEADSGPRWSGSPSGWRRDGALRHYTAQGRYGEQLDRRSPVHAREGVLLALRDAGRTGEKATGVLVPGVESGVVTGVAPAQRRPDVAGGRRRNAAERAAAMPRWPTTSRGGGADRWTSRRLADSLRARPPKRESAGIGPECELG